MNSYFSFNSYNKSTTGIITHSQIYRNKEKPIQTFLYSRVDYYNRQITKNFFARFLTKKKTMKRIIPILKSLCWLPVFYRIIFKVLLFYYKVVNGLAATSV